VAFDDPINRSLTNNFVSTTVSQNYAFLARQILELETGLLLSAIF